MKRISYKSVFTSIGIVLILLAVLSKRFYFKSWNSDTFLSFFAGVATVLVGFLILKLILKIKIKK
jgi:hypothetical protein